MLNRVKTLTAFEKLGGELRDLSSGINSDATYREVIERARYENPWFIPEFTRHALETVGLSLTREKLCTWINAYDFTETDKMNPFTIAVVMAGNIPLVGFHDFISILLSGNRIHAKLSSGDRLLLPFLAQRLIKHYPDLGDHIRFTENRFERFDAVIATGSNNTSRYFEYYFGKYPHIIRKNRNGVAVLTGMEEGEDLLRMSQDVFLYFGLGCRNVAKLFVPAGYDFSHLMEAYNAFRFVSDIHKYKNNYDYYRSIFLINQVHHFDNGFVMITRSESISSPPSVLYYEEYDDLERLNVHLNEQKEQIQCIVAQSEKVEDAIPFGKAQEPELWDYADGVDTMDFLLDLGR